MKLHRTYLSLSRIIVVPGELNKETTRLLAECQVITRTNNDNENGFYLHLFNRDIIPSEIIKRCIVDMAQYFFRFPNIHKHLKSMNKNGCLFLYFNFLLRLPSLCCK